LFIEQLFLCAFLFTTVLGVMGISFQGACIDLFCGAGGLSYGFAKAGFDIQLGIDLDASALRTFKYNHPDALALKEDVRQLSGAKLRKLVSDQAILGMVGGPPCQGFSVAGTHNPDDARNQLPYEYARLLKEVQPAFFLMENVKGLLSKKQRVHFDAIYGLFTEAGYKLDWRLLNAWDYGVAQTRERVFIIGFRADLKASFEWPLPDPSRPVLWDAIGDLPDPIDNEQEITNHALPNPRPASLENRIRNADKGIALFGCKVQDWQQPCKTVTAHLSKDVDLAHPGWPANHGPVPPDSERVLRLISQAGSNGVIPLEVLQAEMPSRAEGLKGRQKKGVWHKPNPTITAQSTFYTGAHYHPDVYRPRRFTVRECARIQSFADSFVFCGSLSAQYRQVGNAVPPKLAYQLAKQIALAFQKAGSI
jgi:DNA (cytosine-5)-methyltransferase 1